MEKVLQLGIRNLIFIVVCLWIFTACYNPIDDISTFSGIGMKGRISLIEKKHINSGGLNGDYSCIYRFHINDSVIIKKLGG